MPACFDVFKTQNFSALNLKIAEQNRDASTSKKEAEPRSKDKKNKKKKSKNRKRRNSSSSSSSDSSDSSESTSGSDSDSSDSTSSTGKNCNIAVRNSKEFYSHCSVPNFVIRFRSFLFHFTIPATFFRLLLKLIFSQRL